MQSRCKLISPTTIVMRILSLLALLSMTGISAVGQDCTLRNLGALPGGMSSSSQGMAINESGSVVGFSTAVTLQGAYHAFLYEKGEMVDLGTLKPSNAGDSLAFAINNRGQVVGSSRVGALTDFLASSHAFLYENGTMTDLGTLDGNSVYSSSEALGINDRGQVVGVSSKSNEGTPQLAFLYENGTMSSLGTLSGDIRSAATAINNSGQIVGYSVNASGLSRAFLYENGVMVNLGTLQGDTYSLAKSINERGQVVGYSGNDSTGALHAFLYDKGVMVSLGTAPGGTYSVATGINNRGQVSGYAAHSLLFEKGEVIDLGTVPGGTFDTAFGINNRSELVGRVITPAGAYAATCTLKH